MLRAHSRLFGTLILAISMIASSAFPVKAHALDPDVRSVLVAGAYGMIGGTIVGLGTLPITKDKRSVFLGSSIGLYLGLAVGFYYILHRHDPSNPLAQAQWPEAREQARAGKDSPLAPEAALLEIHLPVYRF